MDGDNQGDEPTDDPKCIALWFYKFPMALFCVYVYIFSYHISSYVSFMHCSSLIYSFFQLYNYPYVQTHMTHAWYKERGTNCCEHCYHIRLKLNHTYASLSCAQFLCGTANHHKAFGHMYLCFSPNYLFLLL